MGSHWLALVSEVMLQRTKVSSVLPVWITFTERYPDLKSAACSPIEEFRSVLYPLGLRWRIDLLRDLIEVLHQNDGVPLTKIGLMKLPGVGEYVASAFLSFHAGERAVIVDANVVRWICRMTGEKYDGETRRQQWLIDLANLLTPSRVHRDYNYGVLDLAISVCKRKPDCRVCPVSEHCLYWKNVSGSRV